MREQTWYNCQAADGLAKARSRASPSRSRDPDFSSCHICSIDRDKNPRPSTRRRPQLIEVVRDSIASTGPPRAVVRCRSRPTPSRRNSLPTRRRPLPIASNTMAQKLPPRVVVSCRSRPTPSRRNSLYAPPSAAKSIIRNLWRWSIFRLCILF